MTGVFHQEMLNFIVKPQYRLLTPIWNEQNIVLPEPVAVGYCDYKSNAVDLSFDKVMSKYDSIVVYYGSETGTSLKFATMMVTAINDECCFGPFDLDNLPDIFDIKLKTNLIGIGADQPLLLIFTSTFGHGNAPSNATQFIPRMENIKATSPNYDFAVFGLGNSAYVQSFGSFAHKVSSTLQEKGCCPITPTQVADELHNQDVSARNYMVMARALLCFVTFSHQLFVPTTLIITQRHLLILLNGHCLTKEKGL